MPVGRKLSCAREASVATPPRPAPGWAPYGRNRVGRLAEVALCHEGEGKQASKRRLACPVTASGAAEDSSSVGGSPGKQLDRRGIVIWGGSRLFARLLHTARG